MLGNYEVVKVPIIKVAIGVRESRIIERFLDRKKETLLINKLRNYEIAEVLIIDISSLYGFMST